MGGKNKCEQLRAIRRKIAEENNIDYKETKCNHTGDCLGTCPACDAEIKYLDEELSKKEAKGHKVTISGIAANLIEKCSNFSLPKFFSQKDNYTEEENLEGLFCIEIPEYDENDEILLDEFYLDERVKAIGRAVDDNFYLDSFTNEPDYLTGKRIVEVVVTDYLKILDGKIGDEQLVDSYIKEINGIIHERHGIITVKSYSAEFIQLCCEINELISERYKNIKHDDSIMGLLNLFPAWDDTDGMDDDGEMGDFDV